MSGSQLSRRAFLARSAVATSASLVARNACSAPTDDRFGGFLLGVQSYSLRGFPVDRALPLIKELGFSTVEFTQGHFSPNSTPDEIAALSAKVQALGLQTLAFGVNPFSRDHEANRKLFEFAKRAGIRNLSADPKEDAFDSLDRLVAEYPVRIAIHNHGPGARYDKIADVLAAIKGRHPSIGACADLGHYIRSGEDPVKAITLFEGRLYGIHLKDFAEPKRDAAGVILGRGQLDLDATFRALRKVNFPADACLALEYEEKPDNPVDDIKACVEAASEAARRTRA